MSATNTPTEPQPSPGEAAQEVPLRIDRPSGTLLVVEHEPSGRTFEARVESEGIARETETGEPVGDEDHTVVRTKSPFNTDGDWHFWERDSQGTPVSPDAEDPLEDVEITGTDKWAWAAHGMLKEHAPLYDPIALDELGEEVELSDAYAFPPTQDDQEGDLPFEPRPYRVNEESGDIPTGPIIGNRPAEEFLIDVYAVLEGAVLPADGISYETAYQIYDRAEELKADGGPHDQTIMAAVARYVSDPRMLDEER